MTDFESLSIRYQNSELQILDQRKLPHSEVWVTITHPEIMVDCIKTLQVRGAPLIGVSAVLSLAELAGGGAGEEEFRKWAGLLRESRPTAVNLMVCLDRLLSFEVYNPQNIVEQAYEIYQEDVALCDRIATNGFDLIEEGDQILTHCNTGGLATAGVGTALGVIRKAHELGKKIHVFVDETRPLLQGGRLTTWELEKLKVPYTLICDNMAAQLMRDGKITKAIVGADRIATNGDFANKIGTYGVALSCKYHEIPFYMAAPYTTVDPECLTGGDIPIEERKSDEVRGVAGDFGEVIWAPAQSKVYNPAFDVTPADMVEAWIMDTAVYRKADIGVGVLKRHH